jgi:hypothetical protein
MSHWTANWPQLFSRPWAFIAPARWAWCLFDATDWKPILALQSNAT